MGVGQRRSDGTRQPGREGSTSDEAWQGVGRLGQSWTPYPPVLLPATQTRRAESGPRTLQAHPGQAWQPLPPWYPHPPLQGGAERKRRDEEEGGAGRGREGEREWRRQQREPWSQGVGGVDPAGWAEAAQSHTLAPRGRRASGSVCVCGGGSDHHPPGISQRGPKETQRSPSSAPVPSSGCGSPSPRPLLPAEQMRQPRPGQGETEARAA